MKEFFLILFFSKTILLTPDSVDLNAEWTQISLQEPLEAITGGAAIYIDVTKYAGTDASIDKLDVAFPPGTVKARLLQKGGQETLLSNSSAYSFEKDKVYLSLDSAGGVHANKEFTELYVRSDKSISGVSLVWKNYRK